jgi:hypothetical protein
MKGKAMRLLHKDELENLAGGENEEKLGKWITSVACGATLGFALTGLGALGAIMFGPSCVAGIATWINYSN